MKLHTALSLVLLSLLALSACDKNQSTDKATTQAPAAQEEKAEAAPAAQANKADKTEKKGDKAAPTMATAALGKSAPDFKLPALGGGEHSLSQYKGKVVVLEWFNPDCPFVKAAHENGALKTAAKDNQDVVWLAINSGAPGKQGHGKETNTAGRDRYGMAHPILLDEDGKVGAAYQAQRTPQMYIVDAQGKLVYRGALDNTGSGDPQDSENYVNHLEEALKDVRAGKPVRTPETKAWGCSVKYAG